MKKLIFITLLLGTTFSAYTKQIVNVYAWGGEIPASLIQTFEKKSHIKVNFSTFDSNEVMYAKLKTSDDYDVILPSSYFIDKMRKEGLLEQLDKKKLTNFKYINPLFLYQPFDPQSDYSLPYLWGLTGLFYNKNYHQTAPKYWANLWNKKWRDQLLLLDDPREVFSIALMVLGYSVNDNQPAHLNEAYHKLLALMPNTKLFASNTIQALMIDEDITIGQAWNGDFLKAQRENKSLALTYPEEGFVISVDCFAISKKAPHKENAYHFLNFMLSPESSSIAALRSGFATTNRKGYELLPQEIRNNPLIYPPKETLKRGTFQMDIGESAEKLITNLWQKLKLQT